MIVTDISKWQDTADFARMSTLAGGVILRAGADSGSWTDRRFHQWREDAKKLNFPFGNYWYYLGNVHPKRQAEYWTNALQGDYGSLGCWLDIEHDIAHEYNNYRAWWDCYAYFMDMNQKARFGIYTRASFFNSPSFGVPTTHAFRDMPLWIAHYGVDRPTLPKGWATWEFWQFTDSGDGQAFGVGSREIDLNRFNGTEAEFFTRYGQTEKVSHMTANFGNTQVEYKQI